MVGNIVKVRDRGSDPVLGLAAVLEVVVQDLVTLASGQIGDVDDHPGPLQEGKGTWLEVGPGCPEDVVAGGENELAAAVDSRSDLRGHALPTVRQVRAELSGPKRVVKPEQLLLARIPPVGELGCIFQSDDAGVKGVSRGQSQFAGESGLAGGRGAREQDEPEAVESIGRPLVGGGAHQLGEIGSHAVQHRSGLLIGPLVEDLGQVPQPVETRYQHTQPRVLGDGLVDPGRAEDETLGDAPPD